MRRHQHRTATGGRSIGTWGAWVLALAGAGLIGAPIARAGGVQPEMSFEAIEEALTLGRTALGPGRARLHETYRLTAATAPVDYVEIVTPFRRVVLAAQSAAARGGALFGQREALALLARAPFQMDVYVELTFHPLNTYVGVPAFDVALLGPAGTRIAPGTLAREPRFVPRFEGLPPPLPGAGIAAGPVQSAPLVGGTLVAVFDLRVLDPDASYDVLVEDDGTEIARVRVHLGRLR